MQKKVFPILILVVTLFLSLWAGVPRNAAAQSGSDQRTAQCQRGVDALVGSLAEIPRAGTRAREICTFKVRLNQLDSRISEFDKQFVESAIAADMIEIQSIEIALQGVTNEEWRGLLLMMHAMHIAHLEMALEVAEEIGADTTPSLTNARVYPETPAYDLGIRRVNLIEKFIDPLTNAGGPGPTPTAVPTDMTGTAIPTFVVTETGTVTVTALPTDTGTATVFPTDTVTALPTNTGTVFPTDTATAIPTDTGTALPTDTITATLTETTTALPADTATATLTETPPAFPTDTATAFFTETPPAETGTATQEPIGTPTGTPPGGGTGVNFDMLSMHVIEEEHVMSVQVALTAQRLVRNDEIRAFAKHTADAVELHLLLMSDLKHRLFDNYVPPPPDFQRQYQSPRRFEPATGDN